MGAGRGGWLYRARECAQICAAELSSSIAPVPAALCELEWHVFALPWARCQSLGLFTCTEKPHSPGPHFQRSAGIPVPVDPSARFSYFTDNQHTLPLCEILVARLSLPVPH